MNRRTIFFTVLEPKKSKIKALEDMVSDEGLHSGSWMAFFSLSPHMVKGIRSISRVSCIRKPILFMMAPPSCSNPLPKTPSPNTTLRVRILIQSEF
jgi:hypothetical protein